MCLFYMFIDIEYMYKSPSLTREAEGKGNLREGGAGEGRHERDGVTR
jgi:hypothetical protein